MALLVRFARGTTDIRGSAPLTPGSTRVRCIDVSTAWRSRERRLAPSLAPSCCTQDAFVRAPDARALHWLPIPRLVPVPTRAGGCADAAPWSRLRESVPPSLSRLEGLSEG